MYTKFFLLLISAVLFFVLKIWSVLKTKHGEWMTLSAFTKIDIVEEEKNFNDDFAPHYYESYTKILLAAVIATSITLLILWIFNKRIGRKCMSPAPSTSNTTNNVEIIWEGNDEVDESESKFVDNQNEKDNDDIDITTLLEMHKQLIHQDTSLYELLSNRVSVLEQSLFTMRDQVDKLNKEYKSLTETQASPIVSSISSSGIVDLKDILKDVSWHKAGTVVETECDDKECIVPSQEVLMSVDSTGDSKVVSDTVHSVVPNPAGSHNNTPAHENSFIEEEYLKSSKLRFSSVRNKTKRAKLPRKHGTICIQEDGSNLQDQKGTAEVKSGESCGEYAEIKRRPHSRQNRRRF